MGFAWIDNGGRWQECRLNDDRRTWAEHGCSYALLSPTCGRVKIGWTSNHPDFRRAAIQACCPETLRPLGIVPGAGPVETALHRRLADYRWEGEWFDYEGDVVAVLSEVCRPWPGWYEHDSVWDDFRTSGDEWMAMERLWVAVGTKIEQVRKAVNPGVGIRPRVATRRKNPWSPVYVHVRDFLVEMNMSWHYRHLTTLPA